MSGVAENARQLAHGFVHGLNVGLRLIAFLVLLTGLAGLGVLLLVAAFYLGLLLVLVGAAILAAVAIVMVFKR